MEEIVGLGAECMLYMPARCDFDEVCLLLESGTNIVTTGASSTARTASIPR
jgi:hypothetical protein